jgi:hypothetical protein
MANSSQDFPRKLYPRLAAASIRAAPRNFHPFGLLLFARVGYNQQLAFMLLNATNSA